MSDEPLGFDPVEAELAALTWVNTNALDIFLRVHIDGEGWQNRSLGSLPEPLQSYWRGRFVERVMYGRPVHTVRKPS